MNIWTWIAAGVAALMVTFGIWLAGKVLNYNGDFAGKWKASYVDRQGVLINEVLELKSLFRYVWGESTCRWHDTEDRTGKYKVRGLYRSNCLMGVYIPAVTGEHDMGVFIALLVAGTSPTSALGLTTNFESKGEEADKLVIAREQSHKNPLVACDYRMDRLRQGEQI